MTDHVHPAPGEKCPTCARKVPHEKKPASPTSKTIAKRVPLDEVEAHEEVAEAAARFLGVYERPFWRYQLDTLAYALVLQDESLRGFANRRPQ